MSEYSLTELQGYADRARVQIFEGGINRHLTSKEASIRWTRNGLVLLVPYTDNEGLASVWTIPLK